MGGFEAVPCGEPGFFLTLPSRRAKWLHEGEKAVILLAG
jgi:hypothetical protein